MKNAVIMLTMLLLLFMPLTVSSSVEAVIRIGGTGGALGGMKEAAEVFQEKHPDIEIVIAPSLGSSGGIKALLSGALDIAVTSRPPDDHEARLGASALEYGRTPFIFVTSQKGVKDNLTLPELTAIYTAEKRTWLDGNPVRLILRPSGDMDIAYLKEMSPAMDNAVQAALSREGMLTAVTDQENLDTIQRVRGGFGASTLSQVITERRRVKVLRLNGVTPTVQALTSGAYPYYKCFFAVTGPTVRRHALYFIEFLKSKEGRSILMQSGHQTAPFSSCRNGSCIKP